MVDYQKLQKHHHSNNFNKQFTKVNVYPLKPQFQQYLNQDNANTNIVEEKAKSNLKSALVSLIVICTWCLAMCLLAKSIYPFLQTVCIHSMQELKR